MVVIVLFGVLFAFHSALADVSTPHQCMAPPSQKCFTVIVDQKLNWNDAEKYCERNLPNGRLASIHSSFEGNVIGAWLPFLTNNPWIGGIQLGDLPFLWVDSTKFDYTNWAQGQPTQSCIQVCHTTGIQGGIQCQQGKWTTADCVKDVSGFICEYDNFSTSPTTTALPKTTTTPIPTTTTPLTPPAAADCLELHQKAPSLPSGIYQLSPPGIAPFNAYCDMKTDGGGWTVFQRRIDGTLSFYDKTWTQYRNGFDNGLDKNLWLGNEKIRILSTKDSNVDLRIDIWGDRAPGSQYVNGYWWQKQSSFYLDSEAKYYTLHASKTLVGNASISGDGYGINYNIGRPFSTIDNNHDNSNGNCNKSPYDLGGWWLDSCTWSSLNGKYIPSSWQNAYGFEWNTESRNNYINPAQSQMMLRKVA